MPSEPPPAEREPIVIGEEDVDAAIETCGGDVRATIRALLIGTAFLEQALEEAPQEASWGIYPGEAVTASNARTGVMRCSAPLPPSMPP